MEENKKENNMLKPALKVFGEITAWIMIPVILGVLGGKILSKNYGSPWYLIGCISLAFFISSYGMVHAIKKFSSKMKKDNLN